MSPVSRGRRAKGKGPGKGAAHSETDLGVGRLLRGLERELADVDALCAELCVADLLGSWWKEPMPGGDPDVVLGRRLVEQAARRRTSEALGLLRCLAELGTGELRRRAGRAAEALVARGIPDPPWVPAGCTATGCWEQGDVFGDRSTVLVAFDRAGAPHAVAVLVDHSRGLAIDAFVVDDPAATLAELRTLTDDVLTRLRPIAPGEARAVLEPALAATDALAEPPVSAGFAEVRALVHARVRALPEPAEPPGPPPQVPAAERERIVAEFLASPLLIRGEHPEYHEVLDDPLSEELVDGVNPRLHIAVHEIVADQLWAGEPTEAWAAAKRLLDSGMDRHDVLHALAGVDTRHLHGALTVQRPVDVVALRADLDALGAPVPRRRDAARGQQALFGEPERAAPRPRLHVVAGRGTGTGHQPKVTLRGVRPAVWRRLVVPAAITLDRLHDALQIAMGWTDSHLHRFVAGDTVYGPVDPESWYPMTDEAGVRLDRVLRKAGDRVRYEYDFGDGWEHDIVLEEAGVGVGRVECLAGRGACPPEDCGGPGGYAELCAILADPAHPEHAERREWLGRPLAERFDRASVNRGLAAFDVG